MSGPWYTKQQSPLELESNMGHPKPHFRNSGRGALKRVLPTLDCTYATAGFTGLLSCNPNRLPPGCVAEKRLAVDSAKPGRLNALAVLAFCAEITRLPLRASRAALGNKTDNSIAVNDS